MSQSKLHQELFAMKEREEYLRTLREFGQKIVDKVKDFDNKFHPDVVLDYAEVVEAAIDQVIEKEVKEYRATE